MIADAIHARRNVLDYLVPQIPLKDIPILLGFALLGAIVSGAYGVAHDQITYSIAPEYFTNLKFKQFHWLDRGFGERTFAGCIGFMATWWVGLIIGWILARRMVPNQSRARASRKILTCFAVVFATAFLFGLAGNVYGFLRGPNADYSNWNWAFTEYQITDQWAFVRVAYIHNAGYLGGVVGLILACIFVKPDKSPQ
ncbi:hypothetical protein [Mariniblastus fucicola]|uniref:hypothetical protein n=1 Tax=Mariniblastus fucicola TaxID=980251 RepID=UPI0012FCA6BC|nr:hypothetical protein [Mariniblastus fucicola]